MFFKMLQYSQKALVLKALFNKLPGPKACSFVKKSLQLKCFPVNFMNILRTAFFIDHLSWLLLYLACMREKV